MKLKLALAFCAGVIAGTLLIVAILILTYQPPDSQVYQDHETPPAGSQGLYSPVPGDTVEAMPFVAGHDSAP